MPRPSRSSSRPKSTGGPCADNIPAACIQTFREISAQCARLAEGQGALGAKIDAVSRAVLGNGSTKDSLAARVERIESASETVRQCGDRFWKVFAVLVALASLVIAILK